MMKIISKKNYKVGITALALVLALGLAMWASYAYGEQSGGAPESNSTSYIQSLYTALQTATYGSDTASPSWGTYLNRLKTAAQWVPSGTVTAANVTKGKTFYGSDRNLQTGTYAVGNCPTQQYDENNGIDPTTQTINCVDTITWTVPSGSIAGTEKQDPVSGIIWSNLLLRSGSTVVFSSTTNTLWSWDASAATNIAVGNKTAITLCSGMGNGWRLPTQKELMQAFIDGEYFNLSWPENNFWSLTQYSSTNALYVNFANGGVSTDTKTTTAPVRCVR